jgi:hypothetical protein
MACRTAALVVLTAAIAGGSGLLAARHLSRAETYAEALLMCQTAWAIEDIIILRHIEPAKIPEHLEARLAFHVVALEELLLEAPELDPAEVHKSLRSIRSYRSERNYSDSDPEVNRRVEDVLASVPGE